MAKSTRILSGGAKDAYLARTIADAGDLDEVAAARLMQRLANEIALISLKRPAIVRGHEPTASTRSSDAPVAESACIAAEENIATSDVEFDPYSPNVIVVIRTRGRDAILEELGGIEDVASLRLLAREQQLWIAAELDDATDIRLAIVAAAERRIANRRAAAS